MCSCCYCFICNFSLVESWAILILPNVADIFAWIYPKDIQLKKGMEHCFQHKIWYVKEVIFCPYSLGRYDVE